jgi:HEAT repeat protein
MRTSFGFGPSELPRSLAAALRDIESPKVHVRRSAARELGLHVGSSATREVVQRLLAAAADDPDTEVRVQALLALADGGATDSAGSIARLATSAEPRVRQMALLALAELAEPGHPEALQAAHAATVSPLPALRYQGLVALRHLAQLHAIPTLASALSDSDAEVRWVALRLLDELSSDEPARGDPVPSWGVKLVDTVRATGLDANERVATAARLLLAGWGDAAALQQLARLLEARRVIPNRDDELAAIRLVARWGVREAQAALTRRAWPLFFDTPLAFEARVALAALGDARARQSILSDLQSGVAARCARAIEPVGRLRLVSGRSRLTQLLAKPDGLDADAIRLALQRLSD